MPTRLVQTLEDLKLRLINEEIYSSLACFYTGKEEGAYVSLIRQWQGFARVEDIMRVKLLFYLVHEPDGDRVQFAADVVAFFKADAVFARETAI